LKKSSSNLNFPPTTHHPHRKKLDVGICRKVSFKQCGSGKGKRQRTCQGREKVARVIKETFVAEREGKRGGGGEEGGARASGDSWNYGGKKKKGLL